MIAYIKNISYLCIRNQNNNNGEPVAKTSPKGMGNEL